MTDDWHKRHLSKLAEQYDRAERRISAFPEPLGSVGLAYADKFHPVKHEDGKDYICTLLPYWLQQSTGLSDKECGQLVLANVYGMLYFFMLDDVMDDLSSADRKQQLALANLLYLEMFALFRELFPSNSPFWSYYDRYVSTWADCVVNESDADYFMNDPIRTAGKAGPVKICCVGAWLLAGKPERIADSEEAVDIALMTLQMLDDWADWETDLDEGNYNGLVAMIAAGSEQRSPGALTADDAMDSPKRVTEIAAAKEQVRTAIHVHGRLTEFAAIAQRNHEKLSAIPHGMPELIAFHQYMVECIVKVAVDIESKKQRLLGGGLNLLFSKHIGG